MIKISINESPDLLACGEHEFNFHHLTIGRSIGNTIPINDISLMKRHCTLKLNLSGLSISSSSPYFINGKSVIGTVGLNIGDTVRLDQTIFTIINFDKKNSIDIEKYYEALEKISNQDPKLAIDIEKLEELYIKLKSETDHVLEK